MYKRMILIFVFLLCCMFMPIVHAEEIPREGVTYFLQYPDGSEDVKESYDEAIAAAEEEKVIFDGTTDYNGQVTIENIGDTGEVRIVQTVPDGYSTKDEEIKVNLSQKKEVQMTDTLKIINVVTNPKTGMSFILFIFVIGLVILTIKVNKNKKILTVIPLIIAVSLFCNVKAENDDFTVTVKDNLGNGIANVPIKVFAKPVIDAAPAIKFDANGGHFFDGKNLMYVRIPNNGCTWEDLYNSIDDDEINYIEHNTYYDVYREGYAPNGMDEPDTLSNGIVIKNYWDENPEAYTLIIHLNGETINYYGHDLEEFGIYYNDITNEWYKKWDFDYMNSNKIINNKYFGFSSSPSCDNVPIGINSLYRIEQLGYPSDVYLCYSDKKDGIYINDQFIDGNADTCFLENNSTYNTDYNYLLLHGDNSNFYINNADEDFFSFSSTYYVYRRYAEPRPVTNMEIIYNGKTMLSIDSNDISNDGDYYYISNTSKNNQVREYLNRWINKAKNGQCPDICRYVACAQ